jgi:hypothetical protein
MPHEKSGSRPGERIAMRTRSTPATVVAEESTDSEAHCDVVWELEYGRL